MAGSKSPLPETAVAAVRRYCEARIPAEHRGEVRVEFETRGKNVTIFECRPPWDPEFGPGWTRQRVAQLRYDPSTHRWQLYYPDRNGRWHVYDMARPTAVLDDLLAEISDDPTGIFWG